MKLSTKGRYGLVAIVDLAIHADGEPMALKLVAERNDISEGYLEQVFSTLKKAGLVNSIKGAQGGYKLAMPSTEMTVGMVLKALEGDLSTLGKQKLEENLLNQCIKEAVYDQIDQSVDRILEQTYIAQLADTYAKAQSEAALMFFI